MEATPVKPSRSTRREKWAWYFYDFGNSAYAAVVLLAVYSAYFQGGVVGDADVGTRLWGNAVTIAMLTVAIIAPFLGAIADFSGAKKRFLFLFTSLSIVFTGLMFFVTPGRIVLGMLVFILAEIGYRASQVFYNGLLPEIADPDELAEVSGNGWAVGSAGGIVCLLVVLVPIVLTEGRDNANLIVRLSFSFTAVFWVLSAIPIFRWLKERAEPQSLPAGENYLTIAVSRLRKTFKSVRRFREYIKFLIAFLVYNDGIIMALDFAAILGATLYGMSQTNLIIFMIIVQVFNVAGAYLFGIMAKRVSSKATLMVSLAMMVAAGIWMIVNQTVVGFYLIGVLAGVAMAGVQSVSRTMVGLMAPAGQSAEFFGIFAIAGRTSSFIGPFVFAQTVFYLTRYYEGQGLVGTLAEQQGHRIAVWTIVAFLVIGMGLLTLVNERKGKEAAVGMPELIPAG